MPDSSLSTTQRTLSALEVREKRLNHAIVAAQAQLKVESNPDVKARLEATIQQAKDSLADITISKVTARRLSTSELAEVSSKLRKELNQAIKDGDVEAQARIRATQSRISKDRASRNGIRMAL